MRFAGHLRPGTYSRHPLLVGRLPCAEPSVLFWLLPGAPPSRWRPHRRRSRHLSNAPTRLVGTADCGPDGTFDFVANSGNTEATTWTPSFRHSQRRPEAAIAPGEFDLTFTSPFGTFTQVASKATAPGPVACEIAAGAAPGFALTGTVTGSVAWTG